MALRRRAAADHRDPAESAARQREFVRRLAEHEVAGLGLGTGFDHKRMPKALVDEADKRGLPLFEVPYEMPFIAITERAFALLVNEQYAVLERGTQVHERLERLVIEGRGLEAVLGAAGERDRRVRDRPGCDRARAGSPSEQGRPQRSGAQSAGGGADEPRIDRTVTRSRRGLPSLVDRALAVPVPGRRGGAPVGVAHRRQPAVGPLGRFERPDRWLITISHATGAPPRRPGTGTARARPASDSCCGSNAPTARSLRRRRAARRRAPSGPRRRGRPCWAGAPAHGRSRPGRSPSRRSRERASRGSRRARALDHQPLEPLVHLGAALEHRVLLVDQPREGSLGDRDERHLVRDLEQRHAALVGLVDERLRQSLVLEAGAEPEPGDARARRAGRGSGAAARRR